MIFNFILQKTLSSLLREFSKVIDTLPSNENAINLFVSKLENFMKHAIFLETETGKLAIADIFSSGQQLFQVIFYNHYSYAVAFSNIIIDDTLQRMYITLFIL